VFIGVINDDDDDDDDDRGAPLGNKCKPEEPSLEVVPTILTTFSSCGLEF